MTLDVDDLVEKWAVFLGDLRKDEMRVASGQKDNQAREKARTEMLTVLGDFLSGSMSIEEFREIFHQRTSGDWDIFGFKGMSGAMFLNTLVKYIPDSEELAAILKSTLVVPVDKEDAERKMRHFFVYLDTLIQTGRLQKRFVQPARIPFFFSAWWHLQDPETWPIYYPIDRNLLEDEQVFSPTNDVISDYFTFREIYTALRSKLGTSPWEMFNFSLWLDERRPKPVKKLPPPPPPINPPPPPRPPIILLPDDPITHTRVQWMLARIGRNLGLNVWIAKNDWNSEYQGERLGDFSIQQFPDIGMDRAVQNKIEYIDVVWFKGPKNVVAAFEVEHTTSIISGILRLSDLTLMSPNLNFRFYIIVPEDRLQDVRKELSRPTFQSVGLHEMCGFFSEEALREKFDGIMEFAEHYTVIERTLAEKIPQTNW